MDLLKLPTDNLYIFLTLIGIIIFVFSLNQLNKMLIEAGLKTAKLHKKVEVAGVKVRWLEKRVRRDDDIIALRKRYFEKKYGLEFVKREPDEKEEPLLIPKGLTIELQDQFVKEYALIMKMLTVVDNDLAENEILLKKTLCYSSEIQGNKPEKWFRFWFFSLLMFVGAIIMIIGFINWYNKHQKYQDGMIKAQYEKTMLKKN